MATSALMPTLQPATVIDRGGIAALTIGAMKERVDMILELMANVLEEGKDYGKIPGTDKPTLYKPGAEKLCMAFQLAPARSQIEDLSTSDEIRYRVGVPIEAPDGRVLAVGAGEASSNEEKYRWRKQVCDEEFLETPEHLRREKWFKGNGSPYKSKQIRTSPADIANTVLKMAHKRAFIHAALLATAASSVFNQDLEDFNKELQESIIEGDATAKPETRQPQRKSSNGGTAAPAATKPIPENAKIAVGVIGKTYGDKKPYAVYLKNSAAKYTTFDDAVWADIKQFIGTDHQVKLAYTETVKDGKTYLNAVGIAIADAEPATTAAAPAAPTTEPLKAGQIPFGTREVGEEG